jgi:4-diphosphocytidyl-2C-methyl-D-erythritol kinase
MKKTNPQRIKIQLLKANADVSKFLLYLSALCVLCGEKIYPLSKGSAPSINMMGMSSSMR